MVSVIGLRFLYLFFHLLYPSMIGFSLFLASVFTCNSIRSSQKLLVPTSGICIRGSSLLWLYRACSLNFHLFCLSRFYPSHWVISMLVPFLFLSIDHCHTRTPYWGTLGQQTQSELEGSPLQFRFQLLQIHIQKQSFGLLWVEHDTNSFVFPLHSE